MRQALCKGMLLAIVAITGSTNLAVAADHSNHGVRVHKLITPNKSNHPTARAAAERQLRVAPHRHRIVLQKGQRVVIRLGDGIGRSRYRRRYPGIARPWQDRRSGATSRRFMNPQGLYSSKIYRRRTF